MNRQLFNPLTSAYFGQGDVGPGRNPQRQASTGSGNGYGVFDIASLPGYEQFAPGYGQGGDATGIDPQAFADYLAQNGYSAWDEPNGQNGGSRYVTDASGGMVGNPLDYTNDDSAFWNAALAAGALTGANMWGAGMIGGGGGGFMGGSAEPFAATAGSPVVPVGAGGTGGITSLPAWAIDPAAGAVGGGSAAGGYGGLTGGGALTGGAAEGGMGYGSIAGLTNFAAPEAAASWIPGMSNSTTAFLGANVLNGFLGSRAADKSAQALQQAGQQSNDLQRYIFDTARADNKPLLDMRNSVLPQIQGLLSNPSSITSDPGYQFQFGEGQKALNNGAAARGMTYSGAQGKALQRYGQDYGATKLDQSLNRLTNVAGLGQVGANNNQQAGKQYGQTVGNTLTDMGSARGSAYIGGANAWGNSLGNFGNFLQQQELLKQWKGGGT